jgi:8-oxo-dGTP diphosphatase
LDEKNVIMIACAFEDGKAGKLRHAIVDAIVIKDNSVLMVKRTASLVEGGKWGLVGGFVDRDETTKEAVAREVFEESGYRLKAINFFTIIDRPDRKNEDRQNIAFVYVCEVGEKEGKPDWESTDQQWFELNNLPKSEEIAFDHEQIINLYLQHQNNPSIKLVTY